MKIISFKNAVIFLKQEGVYDKDLGLIVYGQLSGYTFYFGSEQHYKDITALFLLPVASCVSHLNKMV